MKSAQTVNKAPKTRTTSKTPEVQSTQKKSPTAAEALALINSFRGEAAKYGHNDAWIHHTILVGDCAGKIAAAIREHQLTISKTQLVSDELAAAQTTNHKPQLIDPDRATALGYLHDIGKGLGPFLDHPLSGYNYLKSHGYDDEFCSICLTHSFTNHECEMLSGYRPDDAFLQNYIATHENSLYEDIATLCDLYCNDQVLPLESRLVDVIIRYGSSDRTAHRLQAIYTLKAKIEQHLPNKTVENVLGLPPSNPKLGTIPQYPSR